MKQFIFIFIFCTGFFAWGATHKISASRPTQLDWQKLALEYKSKQHSGQSVLDKAQPLPNVDFNNVTQLPDYADIRKVFDENRDLRFLRDPQDANFMRRISWLYPDDGCYARASLVVKNIEAVNGPTLSKIFIFGNLEVFTPNAYWGSVSWWFHVAPIVTDGKEKYVLDPAIEPSRPLKLLEWVERMSPIAAVSMAVCDGHSYEPNSRCIGPLQSDDDVATIDQIYFLDYERERLNDLGRDAEAELGDAPPWLN